MKPTTDDVICLAAALAGAIVGTAVVAWCAWELLTRGVRR